MNQNNQSADLLAKPIPYDTVVYEILAGYLARIPLSQQKQWGDPWTQNPLVTQSHKLDKRYLGFLSVREDNPYLVTGTGFEGYFVSSNQIGSDQVLTQLFDLGKRIRQSEKRMERISGVKWKQLLQVLRGEKKASLDELMRLSTILGSEVARLKARILYDPAAQVFKETTVRLTQSLPNLEYEVNGHQSPGLIKHYYKLPNRFDENKGKITVAEVTLPNDEIREAWVTVANLGKVGHPLVRWMLHEAGA